MRIWRLQFLNFSVASDDSVQRSVRFDVNELSLRILSALVMLPVSFAAIWVGGWYFIALIVVIIAAMSLEWLRICGVESLVIRTTAGSLGAATPVLAMMNQIGVAAALLAMGATVSAIGRNTSNQQARVLVVLGIPYIGTTGIAFVWLRFDPSMGLATVLWLMFVVIATDSAGYLVGRTLGGPKLLPRISPKKTWSGLAGGVVAATGVGIIAVNLTGQGALLLIAILSACVAVVAQTGDFIGSGLKRYFSVKDAGHLIPGHGGVLDRLDGFLAATPFVAFLTWYLGGSPLMWR
jgi:phosphatidate cytidylyltransferase